MKWDVLDGCDYDLTRPSVRLLLRGWLRAGLVRAFHMGFPCSSFSRARDLPNGPPRLRAPGRELGLPDLKEADQHKVSVGNTLLRFVFSFCTLAISLHVIQHVAAEDTS